MTALGTGALGLPAFAAETGQSALEYRVYRPEDQFWLTIRLHGLKVAGGRLRLEHAGVAGLVELCFPPQHLAEESFLVDEHLSNPARTRLAGNSRLVFKVGDRLLCQEPRFSLENLLKLVRQANVVMPANVEAYIRQGYRGVDFLKAPVEELATLVEMPCRAFFHPGMYPRFIHAGVPTGAAWNADPKRRWFEGWHTALDLADGRWQRKPGEPPTLVRPLTSPYPENSPKDLMEPGKDWSVETGSIVFPVAFLPHETGPIPSGSMAPTPCQLEKVAKQLSDGNGVTRTAQYMLSPLRGSAQFEYRSTRMTVGTVNQWIQRFVQGRDYYDKVVEQGVLLPFGHKAALVTTWERRPRAAGLSQMPDETVAALERKYFIVVLEPVRDFPTHDHSAPLPSDKAGPEDEQTVASRAWDHAARSVGFKQIEIQEERTPDLKQPVDDNNFWPIPQGGQTSQPFRFTLNGTDVHGNKVSRMGMSLFFSKQLAKGATTYNNSIEDLRKADTGGAVISLVPDCALVVSASAEAAVVQTFLTNVTPELLGKYHQEQLEGAIKLSGGVSNLETRAQIFARLSTAFEDNDLSLDKAFAATREWAQCLGDLDTVCERLGKLDDEIGRQLDQIKDPAPKDDSERIELIGQACTVVFKTVRSWQHRREKLGSLLEKLKDLGNSALIDAWRDNIEQVNHFRELVDSFLRDATKVVKAVSSSGDELQKLMLESLARLVERGIPGIQLADRTNPQELAALLEKPDLIAAGLMKLPHATQVKAAIAQFRLAKKLLETNADEATGRLRDYLIKQEAGSAGRTRLAIREITYKVENLLSDAKQKLAVDRDFLPAAWQLARCEVPALAKLDPQRAQVEIAPVKEYFQHGFARVRKLAADHKEYVQGVQNGVYAEFTKVVEGVGSEVKAAIASPKAIYAGLSREIDLVTGQTQSAVRKLAGVPAEEWRQVRENLAEFDRLFNGMLRDSRLELGSIKDAVTTARDALLSKTSDLRAAISQYETQLVDLEQLRKRFRPEAQELKDALASLKDQQGYLKSLAEAFPNAQSALTSKFNDLKGAGTNAAQEYADQLEKLRVETVSRVEALHASVDGTMQTARHELGKAAEQWASQLKSFDLKGAIPDAVLLGALQLRDLVSAVQELQDLPKMVAKELPSEYVSELQWRKGLQEMSFPPVKFKPTTGPCELILSATTRVPLPRPGQLKPGNPSTELRGNLTNFSVDLFGLIEVDFNALKFEGGTNKSTKVTPEGMVVQFKGALSFVSKLQEFLASLTGSSGLRLRFVDLGVELGLQLALPPISFGAFSLSNIRLITGLQLPFSVGEMKYLFYFCDRAEPFLLSVSGFAGRGFFGVQMSSKGEMMVEGALEFGGCAAVDLIVASGSLYLMGGIYFRFARNYRSFTGYVRAGGHIWVFGFIGVSVEICLGLVYVMEGGRKRFEGEGSVRIGVKIGFFSKSVTVSFRKEFAGSAGGGNGGGAALEDVLDDQKYWVASNLGPGASQPPGKYFLPPEDRLEPRLVRIAHITRSGWKLYQDAFAEMETP